MFNLKLLLCALISCVIVIDVSAKEIKREKKYCIVPVLNQPGESYFPSRHLFETLLGNPHILMYGYGTYLWGIRNFNEAFIFQPNIDTSYRTSVYIADAGYAIMYYDHNSGGDHIRVADEKITILKDNQKVFKKEDLEALRSIQRSTLDTSLKRRLEEILGRGHEGKCIGCNYYQGIRGAELVDPVLMREKDAPAAEKLIITSSNGVFVLGYGKNKGKLCEKVSETYGQYFGVKKIYENIDDVVLDVKPLDDKRNVIVLQSGKFVLVGGDQAREVETLDKIVKKLSIKQALEDGVYLLNSEVIGRWIVFYSDGGMKYLLDLDEARKSSSFSMHAGMDVEFRNLDKSDEIRRFVQLALKARQWQKDKKVVLFPESILVEKNDVVYFINGKPGSEGVKILTTDRLAKISNQSSDTVVIYADKEWLEVSSDGAVTSWTIKNDLTLGERDEIYLVGGELYANVRQVGVIRNKTYASKIYNIGKDGAEAVEMIGEKNGSSMVKYVDKDLMLFALGSGLYTLKEGIAKLMINDPYRIGSVRQVLKLAPNKYLVSAAYGLLVLDKSGNVRRITHKSQYFIGGTILETKSGIFTSVDGELYKID